MNITCNLDDLQRALLRVKPAAARAHPRMLPVLTFVLLVAEANQVRLQTTDLSLGMTCPLQAHIEQEGAAAIPFARLANFCDTLARSFRAPKQKGKRPHSMPLVKLETYPDPFRVSIYSGGRTATIPCVQREDFPSLPTLEMHPREEEETGMLLDLPRFSAMVEAVSCAADPKEGVVVLRTQNGQLTLLAQTALMYAMCESPMSVAGEVARTLVFPAFNLREMARSFARAEEAFARVALLRDRELIIVYTPSLEIVSYLPKQEPFDAVPIPLSAGLQVTVGVAELAAALRYVAFLTERNGSSVRLLASPGGETLLVEAHAEDLGEQATEIAVFDGPASAVFSCETLSVLLAQVVSAIQASQAPQLILEWSALSRALVIRSRTAGESDCLSTYVISKIAKPGNHRK